MADVEIVNFPEHGYNQIGSQGTCPHCNAQSYFQPIAGVYDSSYSRQISAVRCQSCKGYGVVIGHRGAGNTIWYLQDFYPLGTPKDTVSGDIPKEIGADVSEALRCQWIKSYKGCVVLCARAIQASAVALGAKKKKLTDQIDELFGMGKITDSLKQFAHEVRVTRNLGAHPDKDGLEEVNEGDAKDIVAFTLEYMHHVYVMPALLSARRKANSTKPAATP